MSKLKSILRDVGYCSVGAAAVIVEAGSKVVRALVRKGEETLRDNQDTVDEIRRRAKEAGEKIKEAVQDLNKKDEASEAEIPEVDIPEADAPEVEVPEVEVPEVNIPEAEAPATPDVIYRMEESAPVAEYDSPAEEEEPKPEETING